MKREQHSEETEHTQEQTSGEISRRDFLRAACTLGISMGASQLLAGCKPTLAGEAGPTPGATRTATVSSQWIYDPENPEIPQNFPQDRYGVPEPVDGIAEIPLPEGTEPELVPEATPAGEPTATPSPVPTGPRSNITWYCSVCGETFQTSDFLRAHAGTAHGWRLPEIIKVDQPTYRQFEVGKVTAFDERNTVFSRTMWDEEYQAKLAAIVPTTQVDKNAMIEGNALIAGSIYVDDTAGSLHPNYYGYMGRVKNTAGLYNWDDPVSEERFTPPDQEWMTNRIKEVARFYGANLVGVTQIDPRWIYSHTFERSTGNYERNEAKFKYAIVMAIEMDWKHINESPRFEASAATALIYSRMSELASSLAKYIRSLGYRAVPSGNDSGQNIPLAIDAGLGEIGRNGLLITPHYGPRVRLCKVLTDLPLIPDKPIDFGMREFCEKCHSCALSCPPKAIRDSERTTEITSISNRPGLLRWPVDVAKCYMFWRENGGTDCSNCIAVCPWALHSQRDWLELET
jgi:ferredoxin